jgi:hypothetical protein
VFTPERLEPDTAPLADTLTGVISPSVSRISGVVVGFDTVLLMPLLVTTETVVTDPFDSPEMLEAGIVVL